MMNSACVIRLLSVMVKKLETIAVQTLFWYAIYIINYDEV